MLIAASAAAQNLEIHQINVQWGGSVFVKGSNGVTVLMESGNNGNGAAVMAYIQSTGFPAPGGSPRVGFDYVIVGHQHADHMGAIDEVIGGTASFYDVKLANYYNGDDTYTGADVTNWKNASIATTAGQYQRMAVGTTIDLGGGATLTCVGNWNPSSGLYEVIDGTTLSGITNQNDRSVAILIECGGFDYLWASDLGGGLDCLASRTTTQLDVESTLINALVSAGRISAGGIDVLTINHHGSESSTNTTLRNTAQPELALIGVGSGQSAGWNLPRADVVDQMLLAGDACVTVPAVAKVLQTDEGNGVTGPPGASNMSKSGFCVGNIKTVVNCAAGTYTTTADGSSGVNELPGAGLPYNGVSDESTCPRPVVAPSADPPSTGCTSVSTTLHANASGGSGTYPTYAWTPSTGLSCTNCANPNASVSATTTYSVTATDSLGCISQTAQVTLSVSNIAAAPTASPASICLGGSSLLAANATGGIGTKTYSWRALPGGAPFATTATTVVSPASTTTYEVTVSDTLACSAIQTTTVTVTGGSPPAPPATVSAIGGNGSINLSWSSVVGAANYLIYRSSGDCSSPALVQTIAAPTTAWIDGTVSNGTTYCYSVAVDSGSCQGVAGACGPNSCAVPGLIPEVSGGGTAVRLRIAKSGASGSTFSFEDLGGSFDYHLYAVADQASIDSGAYGAKWCDMAANVVGTFSSSAGQNNWNVADTSGFPNGNFIVIAAIAGAEGPFGFKSDGSRRQGDDDISTPADSGCVAFVPKVVISQVYGGGGNSGATYTNDFIELHNAGNATQDLTGWTVQYASATGSTWTRTNLSGVIPPGGYYLVQEGAGTGGTQPLPTPDATGSIAMSATAAKVAVVASTTALTGTCPTGGAIRDFVGYGTTANCFEGAAATPAPSNTNSVSRKISGCQDTNNNSADFTAGAAYPNARNSSTTAVNCP